MRSGWELKKLEEVCSILTCGVASTPKYVDSTIGVPFLSAQNVRNGEIVLDKFQFISKEFHKQLTKKNKPSKGDILYSRVGAKYGEAAVVEHDFEFSVYVSLTLIRPIGEKLNNYYLKYYLNSPFIKSLAKKSISSSGVPNLNVKDVREFPVKYPGLVKQKRIVEILDEAFAAIDKAKANVEKNLQNAKELFESYKSQIFKSIEDVSNKVPLASVCNEIFAGGDAPKENFSTTKTEKYKIPIIANAVENNGLYGYTNLKRVNHPSITIAARGSGTGHTEIRNEPFYPIVRLIVLIPKVDVVNLKFLKYSIQNLNILRSGSAKSVMI